MALPTGSTLGCYKIVALLGAGGMGEVYRAHDPTLGRDVAIKILSDTWLADPDRLARFDREARVLASLNHPHIGAIYSVDAASGVRALVLELVDGLTLYERLAITRGAGIETREALRIARQVADALDAAHEKGIVHRDLKPANIKITAEGIVKVLDFGLSTLPARERALSDAEQIGSDTALHTVSVGSTRDGVILGTAAYMSPEQARGQVVDKRTDIWAFGCLLYEMLTGRSPFAGKTIADSLAVVLEREPAWDALPARTPFAIRRLIERCLDKDPKQRLRDIGDARLEIDAALAGTADAPAAESYRAAWPVWRWIAALVATAMATALIVWTLASRGSPPAAAAPVARLVFAPSPGEPLATDSPAIAISPDGRRIVYVAGRGSRQRLFVRDLDQFNPAPIPGTDGASSPFFSPDGQWVGFVANGKLRKVLLSGGSPQTIAEATQTVNAFSGGSWESDDSIFFTPTVGAGIWQISADGGAAKAVTTLAENETNHRWPQLLPDGRTLLFSAGSAADSQAYLQTLGTAERRALVKGIATRYLPTGHLVYVQSGTLMAVPFDLRQSKVTGGPVPVVSGVMQVVRIRNGTTTNLVPQVSFSTAGTMAYIPASPRPRQSALVWVNRQGVEQPAGASGGAYYQPRIAPDGKRVAVTVGSEDQDDVWLYDLERQTWSRFTSEGNSGFPVWTPDGRRLTYVSDKTGRESIYWKSLDGTVGEERLVATARASFPFSWTRDGVLTFVQSNARTLQDLWLFRVDQKEKTTPFLETPFAEGGPAFSPDGRWMAYVSGESGRNEICVRPFPGPGEKVTISTDGGNEPVWAPSGREIFYRNGDAMMSVSVSTGPSLNTGRPQRLFEKTYELTQALWANYDVAPDGQRFLMVKTIEQQEAPAQINVVLNWYDELKRLAPPGAGR